MPEIQRHRARVNTEALAKLDCNVCRFFHACELIAFGSSGTVATTQPADSNVIAVEIAEDPRLFGGRSE